jgi:hypothetical protein
MYKWRKSNGIAQSHTLMDGGLFFVPIGKSDEFFTDYVECLKHSKLFATELKTTKFKFFVDIDYIAETPLSVDEILTLAQSVHDSVPGRCIVAHSAPKKYKNAIKSGIHMHWPDLIVDVPAAQALAEKIGNPIVDMSVYKGSGIRMLWSHKKGANGDEDPYVPLIELPSGQRLPPEPTIEMLRLCSIRTGPDLPRDQKRCTSSAVEDFLTTCMKNEMRFRGLCPPSDYSIQVRKVSCVKKTIMIQTTSKFCMHKRAEHSSNHVYFVADVQRALIHQRCHDEGCGKYKGMNHTLPIALLNILKETSIE